MRAVRDPDRLALYVGIVILAMVLFWVVFQYSCSDQKLSSDDSAQG